VRTNTAHQATAAELYDFMKRVRSGARVSNDDIKRFAKLFNDEITLDSVDRCVGLTRGAAQWWRTRSRLRPICAACNW
jgi:hypothetical protein